MHAGEKWGSPQGTAHPFPAGKQGLQGKNPGQPGQGHCCARLYFLLWDLVGLQGCPRSPSDRAVLDPRNPAAPWQGVREGRREGAVSQRSRVGINRREQSVSPTGSTQPVVVEQVRGLGVMRGLKLL